MTVLYYWLIGVTLCCWWEYQSKLKRGTLATLAAITLGAWVWPLVMLGDMLWALLQIHRRDL